MANLWMGIDVGTGGTRALLVDAAGHVAGACSMAHQEISMPMPLWAEQDGNDWVQAAEAAIRGALERAGVTGDAVAGIGLSGQMHGVALIDAAGEVTGPCLIWCDQRTQPQVDAIHARLGRERVIELIANPMLTGFSAPKIQWVRENRPQAFANAKKFLLPKDLVRLRLTGEYATDLADASGTGLLDVRRRRWSEEMLAALDLPASLLPKLYEGPEVTGRVSQQAAHRTGLRAGIPVVAGGGDQAAGAVGNGIVRSGIASATVGTSGVVFAATDAPLVDAAGRIHTFCHSVPGQWHVMGVTQGAGLSLRWVRDQLGAEERQREAATGTDAYQLLCELAATAPAGSAGLFFLPYLMGERTPHLDALARGGWIGLTAAHTRAHLVRSVLEGVAYSLRDTFEIFRAVGLSSREARLSGGGSNGGLWPQIQADIYNLPCPRLASREGAAFGAALLAMVGTGAYGSVADACDATLHVADTLAPRPDAVRAYDQGYAVYRELYPRLKDLFPRMG